MAFVQYIPRPGADTGTSSFDFSALNSLKRGVTQTGGDTADKQQEVARQFEAMFLQQLIKQARQSAMPTVFDSDQTRMAQAMGDEQLALKLADPGIGLAKALMEQMNPGKGGSADGRQPPELASSRLPGLRSRIGDEQITDAPSISALIDMLTKNRVGDKLYSAIKGAPDHIQTFVSQMSEAAKVASRESGVPAKLILSQAALESGWGKREIKREDGTTSHNLFGIKASPNWKGKVVNVMTTEYEDGVAKKVQQPFRAYDSYAESFADYARLISQNDRYSAVLDASSPEEAARRIQQAGYATDPSYAEKLISIMAYFDGGSL